MLPVAADIGRIQVDFVGKPDTRFNALGAKGLGKVAMAGVAPAIATAVQTFFKSSSRLLRNARHCR